jgi:hypothetical protein
MSHPQHNPAQPARGNAGRAGVPLERQPEDSSCRKAVFYGYKEKAPLGAHGHCPYVCLRNRESLLGLLRTDSRSLGLAAVLHPRPRAAPARGFLFLWPISLVLVPASACQRVHPYIALLCAVVLPLTQTIPGARWGCARSLDSCALRIRALARNDSARNNTRTG